MRGRQNITRFNQEGEFLMRIFHNIKKSYANPGLFKQSNPHIPYSKIKKTLKQNFNGTR